MTKMPSILAWRRSKEEGSSVGCFVAASEELFKMKMSRCQDYALRRGKSVQGNNYIRAVLYSHQEWNQ